MEKKYYSTPNLKVIEVDMKDIICDSPDYEVDINNDGKDDFGE